MSPTHALLRRVREAAGLLVRPGEVQASGRDLWRIGRGVLTLVIAITNLIGACAVLVIAAFVVPTPPLGHADHVRLVNAIGAAIYVAIAIPAGVLLGTRGLLRLRRWLLEERPATQAETRAVLRAPLRLFTLTVILWFGAALGFGALNLVYSTALALRVSIIVATTGIVTAACAYLLTELLLRPAAARALQHRDPGRLVVPGVATRAVLAWILGSGLPVFGVVAIGVLALTGDPSANRHQLGVAMVVLGGTGIAVGLLAVTVAARATADPVDSVRRALQRVQRGDFGVRVPVYDATQIGQLQLGFNEMVAGLAERERIRAAFGTYVDPDVAARVLEEGTSLAGEEVEVTIMFIDIRDFTGFAERTSANQVVAAINELFEQLVPVIHDHGGWVDKFVGDGLMAVFGAPRRQPDHADQALAAALTIAAGVTSTHALTIGIGLTQARSSPATSAAPDASSSASSATRSTSPRGSRPPPGGPATRSSSPSAAKSCCAHRILIWSSAATLPSRARPSPSASTPPRPTTLPRPPTRPRPRAGARRKPRSGRRARPRGTAR